MEDSQIAALPPELAAEAQNLRRDWETRNRQMQERILTQSFSHALRNPGNRSELESSILVSQSSTDLPSLFRPTSLRSPSQSSRLQHHWRTLIRSHARSTAERNVNNRKYGTKRCTFVGPGIARFNPRAAFHRRSQHQHVATLSRHQKLVLPHPNTQVDHQVTAEHHHAMQRGVDGTLLGAEHTKWLKDESTR